MAAPVFFSHPASAGHDTGDHPERAERIVAIERHLDAIGWFGFERREAPAVEREALERCHAPGYVAAIERFCAAGGGRLDVDTVAAVGSWEAALRSAGGAVAVVDAVLSGGAPAAFSAGRPPGHHALQDRAMGFCLFNNVAVAALHALSAHALERVLILDWDVHHGNGTNDLFHSSAEVLYASIHESPLYPGSGPASDRGSGAGEGFTLNLPVSAGAGDATFCELLDSTVIPRAREYRPQLILISAGYDAHAEDPLGGCEVTDAGFGAMTRATRELAAELEVPLGAVLEGGYALDALARSVAATLAALAQADAASVATA
ncbi:MAG TPA: histone deacetylase [Solirubrobacteraceae bacterium]|jgi:acetoin utilization deacetylase AcuC-like enzyme